MRMESRRGVILILVLVVVSMLTLACLTFAELMLFERRAAVTASRQAQVRVLAQSGAELARQFLDRDPTDQTSAGGLYDNASRFQGVLIADDDTPQDRGHCSVIAPKIEDRIVLGARYGLQDESTRINLTTLLQLEKQVPGSAKQMLMGLQAQGMTDEISDAILDWIDADDTPRTNGAESDYYGSLTPPYSARNGPPVTIEELLLVRDVTPELLFGLDAAGMGLIPAGSVSDTNIAGVDNSDGSMDHGWAAYLTLWSAESNLKADGTPKINLSGSDLQKLYNDLKTALDEPSAKFIVEYQAETPNQDVSQLKPKPSGSEMKSVLDLIGATVTIPRSQGQGRGQGQGQGQGQILPSPITKDSLPKLLDNTTLQSGKSIPGRININQAPRLVMMCIPGMTSDIVDQIIANRVLDPMNENQDQHYETWPLAEGIVDLPTMKKLQPFICAGGSVYRAQVLGYFEKGGPISRLEAMLDSTQHPTKLLFWRDMSRLSGRFPGEPIEQATPTSTN